MICIDFGVLPGAQRRGVYRCIYPQISLKKFMWLFCLFDPGQIRYRASDQCVPQIYTHPNQIPGYAPVCYVAHTAKYLTHLLTLRYVLKSDNLHMTQCAKIIVEFVANVGNVFIKRLQTFSFKFTRELSSKIALMQSSRPKSWSRAPRGQTVKSWSWDCQKSLENFQDFSIF